MIDVTREEFIEICKHAKSIRQLRAILKSSPKKIKKTAKEYDCFDLPVFKPKIGKNIPLEEILAGKHPEYQVNKLRQKLINYGIKEDKCEICGWDKRPPNAQYSPCDLHHINGNKHDHRLENLQILCPNCHSLTPNYKNRK